MPTKYKVIKAYAPFEVGDVLELTGDQNHYAARYQYIERLKVENNPEHFEPQAPEERKPLTADTFFGDGS